MKLAIIFIIKLLAGKLQLVLALIRERAFSLICDFHWKIIFNLVGFLSFVAFIGPKLGSQSANQHHNWQVHNNIRNYFMKITIAN